MLVLVSVGRLAKTSAPNCLCRPARHRGPALGPQFLGRGQRRLWCIRRLHAVARQTAAQVVHQDRRNLGCWRQSTQANGEIKPRSMARKFHSRFMAHISPTATRAWKSSPPCTSFACPNTTARSAPSRTWYRFNASTAGVSHCLCARAGCGTNRVTGARACRWSRRCSAP